MLEILVNNHFALLYTSHACNFFQTMQRKYPSGYEKRKRKRQREDASKKGSLTLFNVGFERTERLDAGLLHLSVADQHYPSSSSEPTSNNSSNSDIITGELGNQFGTVAFGADPGTPSVSELGDGLSGINDAEIQQQQRNVEEVVVENSSTEDLEAAPQGNQATLHMTGYDIGKIQHEKLAPSETEMVVKSGPQPHPRSFPCDVKKSQFPVYILRRRQQNGDMLYRDWLVWSESRKALFCFPCRVLKPSTGHLVSINGWSSDVGWKKLYDRVPEHEKSVAHRESYVEWREVERRLKKDAGIDMQTDKEIMSQKLMWRELLKRIVDVILFLGERSLAIRGSPQRIGCSNNGNFLGIIELLSHYDPLLREHVTKVAETQKAGKRLPAHYLSGDSQNEFISACAHHVRQEIPGRTQICQVLLYHCGCNS